MWSFRPRSHPSLAPPDTDSRKHLLEEQRYKVVSDMRAARNNLSMDIVHGKVMDMKTVSVSVFKQTCLRLLEEVRQTGKPLRITKRGVPIAEVVPVARDEQADWRGSMRGTADIVGDIVAPATDPEEWEALRE